MRAYVADAKSSFNDGAVHVVDLDTAAIIRSLPALHNPDVALSPDGRHLYVVQANLDKDVAAPDRDELLVYDTATLDLVHKVTFTWRSLYNIAPSGPSIVPSHDGRFVYVNKTQTLGDDAAINTVAVFDVAAGGFQPDEIRLPYQVTSFGTIPGTRSLYFALSGRLGDAVACVDLERGMNVGLKHEFGDQDVMRHRLAGAQAHPSQPLVYIMSRDGYVQQWHIHSDLLSEPVRLDLEEGSAVPIPHLVVTSDRLLVGVSDAESAARGLSTMVKAYHPESGADCLRTWMLRPPAEKIALSPDHFQILALNRLERELSAYVLAAGERRTHVTDLGESPVSFVAGK